MTDAKTTTAATFSAEERAAMKERAREQKAEAKRGGAKADGLADVLARIAEMSAADRAIAQRIHDIITTTAPSLAPKTWYGQPAYTKDGKVICFFQSSGKFKTRYSTLGFSEDANLDEGTMWPTSYALTTLTAADEKAIVALIKQAVR